MTKNPHNRINRAIPATCQAEAILSIDSRGQIVIPKEVRKRANIQDGDRLALVSWLCEGRVFAATH